MGVRKRKLLGLVATFVTASSSADAGLMQWEGSLTLDFLTLPSPVITGIGVATLNSSAGGAQLATLRLARGITGSAALPVTDPQVTAAGILSVRAAVTLGTGALGPFWPPVSFSQLQLTEKTLPVRGVARLCMFANCMGGTDLPLTVMNGATGVGIGGILTVGGYGTGIQISVEVAPWTVGTASVAVHTTGTGTIGIPAFGDAHGPASLTGSTALTGGLVSVVTPMQVTSSDGRGFTGFARLAIRFVPEPGFVLLLVPGAVGLAMIGRHRIHP